MNASHAIEVSLLTDTGQGPRVRRYAFFTCVSHVITCDPIERSAYAEGVALAAIGRCARRSAPLQARHASAETLQHVEDALGRPPDDGAPVRDHDGPLDEDRVLDERADQRHSVDGRVVEFEIAIRRLTLAHE